MKARVRVLEIARREIRQHLKSPLLWGLVLFTAFATLTVNPAAMIPTGDAAVGGVRPFSNSRYAMAQSFALTGLLFYTFLTSILAGLSIPNDDDAKIGELIHSTPLTSGEYIAGKFAGVVGALGVVLGMHVGLAMAWYEWGGALGSDAIHGPFRALNYIAPALVFLAPGVLFCAGLSFAAGERTRSVLAVYSVPTAIFFLTLAGLIPRPASSLDAVLVPLFTWFDVWGARWLTETVFHVDRGVDFYNTAPLVFDSGFLLNRLLILGLPTLAVLASVSHARRVVRGEVLVSRAGGSPGPAAMPAPASTTIAPPWRDLGMTSSAPGLLPGALEVARAELHQARAQPAVFLFGLLAVLLTLESAGSARGVFDSRIILTAGGLAVTMIEVLTAIGSLFLLFHLVEGLDRSQRLGVQPLVFSSPIRTGSLILGVQLAGALLVLVTLAACAAAGLVLLALAGRSPMDTWPFVLVWGGILGPTFLVWSSAVVTLFAALRDRYRTYVVGFAVLGLTVFMSISGSLTWVTNWPLWGALRWTDMGLFELEGEALLLNRLLMLSLTALFTVVAGDFLERTERDALARRAGTPGRFPRRALRLAPILVLILVTAGVLTDGIRKGPDGATAKAAARNYWLLNSATWSREAPPRITHVDALVDLEPSARTMRVRGAYTLVNDQPSEILRVPLTVGDFEDIVWTVNGERAEVENRSGLHLVALKVSLPAGESVRIGFSYSSVLPRGFSRNGGTRSEFILPSGVVLSTLGQNFLPTPGYVEGIGVDEDNRVEVAEPPPDSWKGILPPVEGNGSVFTSRIEVSAPAEFVVNGVGEKVSEQTAGGRTTVIWESDHPVRFLNLVAARWKARRLPGVAVFHHAGHQDNVEEILNTLAAARRRYSEWFGEYPWKELRLSEYPDYASRAQSFPTNIPFSEGIGFLTRSEGGSGLPTIVTAHEVAHQWWAHLLMPGRAPGADLLLEGMAHFSTMLFLEAEHGEQARIEFGRQLEERYAETRRVDAERPLGRISEVRNGTDLTCVYDRGAWVMWMLQQQLGREEMLAALRSFIRRFEGRRDHPALQDLIEELRSRARDQARFQTFVDQWLFGVVMPEFQIREPRVTMAENGWNIEATVENVGTGAVGVEIAAARAGRSHSPDSRGDKAYLDARTSILLVPNRPVRVSWSSPFEPHRLVIDPDALVLQLNRARAECGTKCLGLP